MADRALPAVLGPVSSLELIGKELASAEGYAKRSWAASTVRAYESDWRLFKAWCAERSQVELPASPATVAAFLADEADRGRRPQTVTRRGAAIRYHHHLAGQDNPCEQPGVRAVLAGIRRKPLAEGEKRRKVAPLRTEALAQVLAKIPTNTHLGRRDRALILLGFAAALRRSELVALRVEDLEFDANKGLLVTVRSSKTDQEGKGAVVAVPYAQPGNERLCPVRAVSEWLQHSRIGHGAVFRQMRRGDTVVLVRKDKDSKVVEAVLTDQSVALVVKRRAKDAGLDTTVLERLAGHSLRAGYATSAAAEGIEERKIANVTRHKNLDVLRGYIRPAVAFDDVGRVL